MSTRVDTDAEDEPGVVQSVLGLVVGLGFVGVGLFVWSDTGDLMSLAIIAGMGSLFVVLAAYSLIKNLATLDTYDPIYIIGSDMNSPGHIVKGLIFLAAFWVVFLYVLGASNPSEAVRVVSQIRSNQPELLVGWVGFNALFVLAIVFGNPTANGGGPV
jgi:hypothetical protein